MSVFVKEIKATDEQKLSLMKNVLELCRRICRELLLLLLLLFTSFHEQALDSSLLLITDTGFILCKYTNAHTATMKLLNPGFH